MGTAIALMVGLRHQVGGDWENYLENSLAVVGESLQDALSRGEPGYWLITWLTADTAWNVHLANLFFASLFSVGLIAFCRAQPRPWLAFAVAVPYLIIVLGMGYTRQGVALSLAMIGMLALERKRWLSFILWIGAAALFHKSAVILMPLGLFAIPRKRWWAMIAVGAASAGLYYLALRDSVEAMSTNYLEAQYQSEGALIRVMMNVLPAAVLLIFRKRLLPARGPERSLWITVSILAVCMACWLAVSPSSTAVDRVALYLIPLQLYVFSRAPDIFARTPLEKKFMVGLVLIYYGVVQLVWLQFATHSSYWVPYRFFPLQAIV